MKHTLLTILLTIGFLGGLAAGFRSLRPGHGGPHDRAAWEAHIADLCVDAAARAAEKKAR